MGGGVGVVNGWPCVSGCGIPHRAALPGTTPQPAGRLDTSSCLFSSYYLPHIPMTWFIYLFAYLVPLQIIQRNPGLIPTGANLGGDGNGNRAGTVKAKPGGVEFKFGEAQDSDTGFLTR